MKLVSAFLIGIAIIDSVVAQVEYTFSKGKGYSQTAPAPAPAPSPNLDRIVEPCYSPHGRCKQCEYQNGCKLRVDVTCFYYDSNGFQASCLGTSINDDDNNPFKIVNQNDCDNGLVDQISATIKYRMCNDNNIAFIPSFNLNYIRYQGIDINDGDWNAQLLGRTCREEIYYTKINPCRDPAFQAGIVIQMEGNLARNNNNWCKCRNKETSRVSVRDPIGTTESPTISSSTVSSEVTRPEKECNFENVVITELALPAERNAKYIELFFFECRGKKITQDLFLIRYLAGEYSNSPFVTNLKYTEIRDDGFLTVCNSAYSSQFYGRNACTKVTTEFGSPADLKGTEAVAISSKQDKVEIIDIFGYPGEDSVPSPQYFKNGRAVRKTTVTGPSKYFKPTDWHVFPGKCDQQVGYEGMDINEWKDVQGPICAPETTVLITEIVDYHHDNEHGHPPRYIELYAPWKKDRETYLGHDLKLVIFPRDSKDPTWSSAVKISQFPENGFLLVCNQAAYGMYAEKCGILDSYLEGPANSAGRDTIALVSGDENGYFVVDVYGEIGESSGDSGRQFTDTRVIRKKSVDTSQATFNRDHWQKCPRDTPDPNEWETDECGKAPGAPSATPTHSPTKESQKNCELFFTEIVDTENMSPYIEVRSTCPGTTITRAIHVVSYKQYGNECDFSLEGVTIPAKRSIIICPNKNAHNNAYGQFRRYRCDYEDTNLFQYHGTNSYALVNYDAKCHSDINCSTSCRSGCNDKIVDIYGYLHQSLINTEYAYKGCRVVRKMTTPYGVNSFNFANWEIVCPSISYPQPGENPDPGVWKAVPLVLLFSEICDPNQQGGSFIELYSPNKSNYRIVEDLIIKRFEGQSITSNGYEKLTGLTINEDGFLILCIDQWETGKCSKSIGWNSIITPGAASTYCIAKCANPYEECPCVDWYGNIGLPTIGSDYDYSGGRAYRIIPFAKAGYFDESHWRFVNKISQYDECDPGELTPPSPYPNPTPNTKPNWRPSKGGPSKGKRRVLRK